MNKKRILFFAIIFSLIFINSVLVMAADYDPNDPATWFDHMGQFRGSLNEPDQVAKINEVLKNTPNPDQREYIFKGILDQIRTEREAMQGTVGFLERVTKTELSKVLGVDTKKITPVEKIIGFENSKLMFKQSPFGTDAPGGDKGRIIVGDGNVWLNMDDIPNGVTEIEYDGKRFILRTKTGAELIVEKGGLNLGKDVKDVEGLNGIKIDSEAPKGSKIVIGEKGIVLSGGAKLELNGKVFTQNDKTQDAVINYFGNYAGDLYRVRNAEVIENGLIAVKTPVDRDTLINFGNKDNGLTTLGIKYTKHAQGGFPSDSPDTGERKELRFKFENGKTVAFQVVSLEFNQGEREWISLDKSINPDSADMTKDVPGEYKFLISSLYFNYNSKDEDIVDRSGISLIESYAKRTNNELLRSYDNQVVNIGSEARSIEAFGQKIELIALGELTSVGGKGDVIFNDGNIPIRFDDKNVYGPRLGGTDDGFVKEVAFKYTEKGYVWNSDREVFFQFENGKVTGFRTSKAGQAITFEGKSYEQVVAMAGSLDKELVGNLYNLYKNNELGGISLIENEAKARYNGNAQKEYNEDGKNLPVFSQGYAVNRIYNLNNPDLDFEIRPTKAEEEVGGSKGLVLDRPNYFIAGHDLQTKLGYEIAKGEIRIPKQYKTEFDKIKLIEDNLEAREKFLDLLKTVEFESRITVILKTDIRSGAPLSRETFLSEMPNDPKLVTALTKEYVTSEDLAAIASLIDKNLKSAGVTHFPQGTQVRFLSFPYENGKFTKNPEIILTTPDGKENRFVISDSTEQMYLQRFLFAGFATGDSTTGWPPPAISKLWCEKIGKPSIPQGQVPFCKK